MEDQACPKCKTSLYRNPQMKLLVNVCGHNLCDSCVELLFVKGSGSCPECGIPLRRTNFRFQLFEDAAIDKEVDIRKRILKDFNKKEEDFETLSEYNDYLEMVEDIIFNLGNNIDILETNKRIAEYKEKNKDFIAKNRARLSRETLELQGLLLEEARQGDLRNKETKREMELEKKLKEESKEKLIDDLMFSDGDAKAIVSQHSKAKEEEMATIKLPKFSTGMDVRNSGTAMQEQMVAMAQNVQFKYDQPTYENEGPAVPGEADLRQANYFKAVRSASAPEKAAGYTEQLPCVRALQDAMNGLFFGS